MVYMNMNERIFDVIKQELSKKKLFEQLAMHSGISAASWKSAAYNKQRPTIEMIEWVCKQWPMYAYYITTGEVPTESVEHTSPALERKKNNPIEISELLAQDADKWSAEETIAILRKLSKGEFSQEEALIIQLKLDAKEAGLSFNSYIDDTISKKEKLLALDIPSSIDAGEDEIIFETEEIGFDEESQSNEISKLKKIKTKHRFMEQESSRNGHQKN
jgi:hypothetical protein